MLSRLKRLSGNRTNKILLSVLLISGFVWLIVGSSSYGILVLFGIVVIWSSIMAIASKWG